MCEIAKRATWEHTQNNVKYMCQFRTSTSVCFFLDKQNELQSLMGNNWIFPMVPNDNKKTRGMNLILLRKPNGVCRNDGDVLQLLYPKSIRNTYYFFFSFQAICDENTSSCNQINNNGTGDDAKSLTMHDMSHAHSPESVDTNSALTLRCEQEMFTPDAV